MRTVAVAHQKGGVGKTTAAVNLAAALALFHDRRVLLIDLDPSGDAGWSVGIDLAADAPTMAEVFAGEGWVTYSTAVAELDVVPSDARLVEAEETATLDTLRKLLRGLDGYDVVVVDTPPSLRPLALTAIGAADVLLIPAWCRALSRRNVRQTLDAVAALPAANRPKHTIVVPVGLDRRASLPGEIAAALRDEAGPDVLVADPVPDSMAVSEATERYRAPVFLTPGKRTPAAAAFADLAATVARIL